MRDILKTVKKIIVAKLEAELIGFVDVRIELAEVKRELEESKADKDRCWKMYCDSNDLVSKLRNQLEEIPEEIEEDIRPKRPPRN